MAYVVLNADEDYAFEAVCAHFTPLTLTHMAGDLERMIVGIVMYYGSKIPEDDQVVMDAYAQKLRIVKHMIDEKNDGGKK